VNLPDKVFRSLMGESARAEHLANEANYLEDCREFAAMPDAQLAERAQRYLDNSERPRWPRGTPVYDAVMAYTIVPEMIRRLRD
jgi:hypothetical protein